MLLKKWVLSFMYLVSVDPMDWSVIYKCFQEDLMEGVIREEDREDREEVNCHGNTHNKALLTHCNDEATSVFCLVALQWILDFYNRKWMSQCWPEALRPTGKKTGTEKRSAEPWVNVVKLTLGRRRIDPWNDVWHWIRLRTKK